LAACAGGDNDDGVATLGNGDQAGAATASPSIDPEGALAEFAECMRCPRGRGLPGPQVDDDAGIEIGEVAPTGSLIEMDREVIDEAMGACQDLLPAGGRGPDLTPRTRPSSRTRLSSMRSACEHGVEDIPDPGFAADGAFIQRIDPGIANSDEFRGADEACQSIIEDAHPGGEWEVTTNE
jgi:hypothetical protein